MRWRTTVVLLGWALALTTPCRAQTPPLVWSPAGPAAVAGTAFNGASVAGPVNALALAPNGTVFAGGPGGVWNFAPATNTWTAVSSGAPVGALAIVGGNLYAGTGEVVTPGQACAGSGILLSPDGGGHWTTLGAATFAGLAITRIAVNPNQPSVLLAVAALPPGSPAGPSPGLYASHDGGATWSQLLTGNVRDVAWNASSGEVLAAESTAAGMAVGTVLELSQTGETPFVPLTLSSASTGRVALSSGSGGGFLAFWSGAQPELVTIGGDGSTTMLPLPASLGTGTTTGLAVNTDGTHIWIGAANVWESSDDGQSWTDLSMGVQVGTQQHALINAPGGGLWTGNDGGVWMALPGEGLQNKNTGLRNYAPVALALTASGAAAAWAGDSDGAGAGTLAPGSVWGADGNHFFSALAASGSLVYGALRGGAQLLVSSDGGQTWATANLAPAAITGVTNALAATANMVWLGTSTGELWASSDGGAAWLHLGTPAAAAAGITALAAGGGGLWLAAGENLWSSADGGQSWTLAPDPGGAVSALAAAPAHADEAAAVTPSGAELLDAGAWTPLGAAAAPITALAWDGSDTLWAATLGRGFWSLPLAQVGLQVTLSPTAVDAIAGQSAPINFTVQASDLSGSAAAVALTLSSGTNWTASATTGVSGTATVAFPVPPAAGDVTVLAAATGAWGTATSTATVHVLPAALSQIHIVAGGSAPALVGTILDLTLEAEDRYGNPIPGAGVALSGPGTFSPASVTTNADGRANAAYTLPAVPGSVTLTASAGSVVATWTETALPAPSYSLVLTPPAAVPPSQSTATVTVQVVPGAGGYSAPVTFLDCQPAPGCSFSAAAVSPPYPAVTMTVDLASRTAGQSSFNVTAATDATHTVTVAVPLQGFTLASSATALKVTAGETSEPVVLTLTPVNGMAGNVSFAAAADSGPLPSWMVPQFTPGSLALPTNSTASFSVSTVNAAGGAGWVGWRFGPGPLLLLLLVGSGFACLERRRATRLGLVLGLVLASAGCGGGGGGSAALSPPPPAPTVSTYTLQLTATAGGLQASVPVQVSVTAR